MNISVNILHKGQAPVYDVADWQRASVLDVNGLLAEVEVIGGRVRVPLQEHPAGAHDKGKFPGIPAALDADVERLVIVVEESEMCKGGCHRVGILALSGQVEPAAMESVGLGGRGPC